MNERFSMVIRWSEEDQVFVVSLPEFGDYAQTHGDTYEEAARNGQEVLELLVESFQAEGRSLPTPRFYEGNCSDSAGRKTMNYLTADQVLLERLAGLMEPAEIRDANGKVIGRFTPMFADESDKNERAERYFDLADAERSLAQEPEQEFTHAEVWERIRSGEIKG